jgi:hypothetical protein
MGITVVLFMKLTSLLLPLGFTTVGALIGSSRKDWMLESSKLLIKLSSSFGNGAAA